MAGLMSIWTWLHGDLGVQLMAAIVVIDHTLAAIPSIAASSTGQAILGGVIKVLTFLGFKTA